MLAQDPLPILQHPQIVVENALKGWARGYHVEGLEGWELLEAKRQIIDSEETAGLITAEEAAELRTINTQEKRDLFYNSPQAHKGKGRRSGLKTAISNTVGVEYDDVMIIERLPATFRNRTVKRNRAVKRSGKAHWAYFAVEIYLPQELYDRFFLEQVGVYPNTSNVELVKRVIMAYKRAICWLKYVKYIQKPATNPPTIFKTYFYDEG